MINKSLHSTIYLYTPSRQGLYAMPPMNDLASGTVPLNSAEEKSNKGCYILRCIIHV